MAKYKQQAKKTPEPEPVKKTEVERQERVTKKVTQPGSRSGVSRKTFG